MHIDLTGGELDWDAICDLDFRICMTLHAANQQTLFVGGLHPHTLAGSPETRYFPRIERCALVCDDADMESRMHSRGMEQEAIDGFLGVNRWYKEEGPSEGIKVLNTSDIGPEAVANRVTRWVESTGDIPDQ